MLDPTAGVAESSAEASAASVSPNDNSAITSEPTTQGVDSGSPATTGAEAQTASTAEPATAPDEIASLQENSEGWQRLRGLYGDVRTERDALKAQMAQPPQQTEDPSVGLRFDKPVDEWMESFVGQTAKWPEGYYRAVSEAFTDFHMAERLPVVLGQMEQLPPELDNALSTFFESRLGASQQEIIEAVNLLRSGQAQSSTIAQPNTPQSNFAQQLIDEGYAPDSQIVQNAQTEYQRQLARDRQYQALEGRLNQFESNTQRQTQEQAQASERQRNQEFEQTRTAAWDTILGSITKAIPQGYERVGKAINAEAKDVATTDSLASQHLTNAKAALTQAHKYRAQNTPELAQQAMDKHSREMTAYTARVAVLSKQIAKPHLDLIAENVSLKNRVTQRQQQHPNLIGGNGNGAGDGFLPRQPGEDIDAYLARATENRRAKAAQLDAQR